jgi:putative spermidine/putrescine transport system permease protein
LFSVIPVAVVLIGSFADQADLWFPPHGFSLTWYRAFFASATMITSVRNSIELAALTSLVAVAIGIASSVALVRFHIPGRKAVEALLLSPLGVSPVVIGLGVLELYIALHWRSTLFTLLLGHLVITVPFTVRLCVIALDGADRSVERAAASMGASPQFVF